MSDDPIKKPNALTLYTDEEQEELLRCKEDPIYFITNHLKAQHPIKGLIPLVPYPFQVDMITAFHIKSKVIALCGRQQGKCIYLMTKVTRDGHKVFVSSLVRLKLKEKVVNYLERFLVRLNGGEL